MVNHYLLGIELVHGLCQVYPVKIDWEVVVVVKVMKVLELNLVVANDQMVTVDSMYDSSLMMVGEVRDK